jgi:hypothetical protein
MAYIPTGYPRGRPRIGEERPLSKGALWQRKYRAENRERYNEINRAYQARWRAANPERAYQIGKESKQRAKLRKLEQLKEVANGSC